MATTTTALRRQVLGLYRACMRSARKCPEWEKREMMKAYVRMKFRDEAGTRDTTRIQRLLADAREELAQMEYYHAVYEEKQRQRATARSVGASAGPAVGTVATSVFTSVYCPECGTAYVPAQAKFCSSCGTKRV